MKVAAITPRQYLTLSKNTDTDMVTVAFDACGIERIFKWRVRSYNMRDIEDLARALDRWRQEAVKDAPKYQDRNGQDVVEPEFTEPCHWLQWLSDLEHEANAVDGATEGHDFIRYSDIEELTQPIPILPYLAWKGQHVVIGGQAKSRKTTIISQALTAYYNHDAFLGIDSPGRERERVAYISEMHPGRLKSYMERFGKLDPTAELHLTRSGGLDNLKRFCDEHKPTLVIVDSLTLLASASDVDQNDATSMRKLQSAMNDCGVSSTLTVHHYRKLDNRLRGSTDIEASADMLISFDAPDGFSCQQTTDRVMRFNGRFMVPGSDDDERVYIALVDGKYVLAEGPSVSLSELARKIAEYLQERSDSGVTLDDCYVRLHNSKKQVNEAYSEVVAAGVGIERQGRLFLA